jgi:hypothetical protein
LKQAMRALRSPSAVLAWAMAFGAGLGGCGDGASAVHVPPDAVSDRGVDAEDGGDAADAPPADLSPDAPSETGDGADDFVEPFDASVNVPSDAKADASPEVAADAAPTDVVPADVAPVDVAMPDLPVGKASATASWTIAPDPMCTAAGAGCMDTGAVGGYQVTASGTCTVASSVQLWFPGGASPLPAATYAVKPADGILDVIAMPAGMVGVAVERGGVKSWGRSGAATVSVAGAGRRVMLSNVILKQEGATAMTSLTADVTCP